MEKPVINIYQFNSVDIVTTSSVKADGPDGSGGDIVIG